MFPKIFGTVFHFEIQGGLAKKKMTQQGDRLASQQSDVNPQRRAITDLKLKRTYVLMTPKPKLFHHQKCFRRYLDLQRFPCSEEKPFFFIFFSHQPHKSHNFHERWRVPTGDTKFHHAKIRGKVQGNLSAGWKEKQRSRPQQNQIPGSSRLYVAAKGGL